MKLVLALVFMFSTSAYAVSPGDKAIDFSFTNHKGEKHKLSDFKGKFIVLEWYNGGCPYVRKHYDSGNMQATQKLYKDNDLVTWVSIISSAEGKQGFLASDVEAAKAMKDEKSFADHLLRDVSGKIGQKYGAKTTPHIFIIDHEFKIQYAGAIDSISSADKSDIKKAKNYVTSSISKMMLKEKPSPQKTRSYGCSVKY